MFCCKKKRKKKPFSWSEAVGMFVHFQLALHIHGKKVFHGGSRKTNLTVTTVLLHPATVVQDPGDARPPWELPQGNALGGRSQVGGRGGGGV